MDKKTAKFHFMPSSEEVGWDALAHSFTDNILNFGKDLIQNSVDRTLPESQTEMVFELLRIPMKTIPFGKDLIGRLESCLEQEPHNEIHRAVDFLKKPEVMALKITDLNTSGLTPKHFKNVLRKVSLSSNIETNSLGTAGIGKVVSFQQSACHTVVYSTIYEDDQTGGKKELAAAKCILASHKDPACNPHMTEPKGYYPEQNSFPELSHLEGKDIPEWARHDPKEKRQGTTITILAYLGHQTWKDKILVGAISSFFDRILDGKLKLTLREENDADIILDENSIINFLDEDKIESLNKAALQASKENEWNEREAVIRALHDDLLRTKTVSINYTWDDLTTEDGIDPEILKQLTGFKEIRFRLFQKDDIDFPKIVILRDGMYIGQSSDNEMAIPRIKVLGSFRSHYKPFILLIDFPNEPSSRWCRLLEDQEHKSLQDAMIYKNLKGRIPEEARLKITALAKKSLAVLGNETRGFLDEECSKEVIFNPGKEVMLDIFKTPQETRVIEVGTGTNVENIDPTKPLEFPGLVTIKGNTTEVDGIKKTLIGQNQRYSYDKNTGAIWVDLQITKGSHEANDVILEITSSTADPKTKTDPIAIEKFSSDIGEISEDGLRLKGLKIKENKMRISGIYLVNEQLLKTTLEFKLYA